MNSKFPTPPAKETSTGNADHKKPRYGNHLIPDICPLNRSNAGGETRTHVLGRVSENLGLPLLRRCHYMEVS